jgi:hypothetical protein
MSRTDTLYTLSHQHGWIHAGHYDGVEKFRPQTLDYTVLPEKRSLAAAKRALTMHAKAKGK